MDSPPVPGELLVDIFLRLADPADLVRASAACVSFGRIIANRSFLRQYRKLHAPPLLGLLSARKTFHPVDPPHPSAPAATAVALAADFSFSFLPTTADNWVFQDIRDGRVLLARPGQHDTSEEHTVVFREMVVCDPLHRRYLVLPQTHENLVAPTVEVFLIPADSDEETSFRVMWMGQGKSTLFGLVFSSSTGQWQAVPSQSWIDLFAGLVLSTESALFYIRKYAYGCFYWVANSAFGGEEVKMLVFDTRTMEFSVVEAPPEANSSTTSGFDTAMVEAGEGRLGMFVLESTPSATSLHYSIMQNNGGSSNQWRREKTLSLSPDSWYLLTGSVGRYLHLLQGGRSSPGSTCFTLDTRTFKFERVCGEQSGGHPYSNFPPLLLSSPTVSSGTQGGAEEMLEQSMEALRVGEPIDMDAGGGCFLFCFGRKKVI